MESTGTKDRWLSVVEEQLKIFDGTWPGQEGLGFGELIFWWLPTLSGLLHPYLALLADRVDSGRR